MEKKFCKSFCFSFPVPCTSQGSVSSWKVEPKNSLSRWYYLELNDNMKNHFIIEHLSNACTFALSLNQKKKIIIIQASILKSHIYLSFNALRKFLLPEIKTFVRVLINNILQYIYIYIYIERILHGRTGIQILSLSAESISQEWVKRTSERYFQH